MKDGALPRFDRSELLYTIGALSQKSCAEFFMIGRDRRFKSFAGLEKEHVKKIFRHATDVEEWGGLVIRGSSIDWPSSGPYGRERGRFRRG